MKNNELFVADFVPVSLIDYPGEVSSTVFTYGCNLRCRYCHNPELVIGRKLQNRHEEFLAHLRGKDLDGVAVTGGEPLYSSGIFTFLRSLKKEGYLVKLDTNGFCPEKLQKVISEGLIDMAAVDVKAFNDEDLKYITRSKVSMDSLYRTIEMLEQSGVKFELRHTIWKVPDMADVKKFMKRYNKLLVQFPVQKGRWLDKTFQINLTEEERAGIKSGFSDYDITFRND